MYIRDLLFHKVSLYVPSYLFWCQKIWENVLLLLLRHSNKGRFTKNLPPQFTNPQSVLPSSWNENYGRYCKQHFIRLFFENFDHIPSFLKLKKMASKIFLNRSFKNIYHLLICFINEIINDAAPAMIDLRFLHNSKVLIGRLPKVNYILFWLYTTHIKIINNSRLCVLAIV